ncbi:MAG: isoprenylcysteine carboxylmethyltransferase family protein [Anaerolineales bacterium]|nr:isoprenylcysteine carboxylmethyltransferase family protein [Anaerolineales bacterium]
MTVSNQTQPESMAKGILIVIVFLIGVGAAFFVSYGSLFWWEAWLLLGMWALYFVLMLTVVRKINPGLVKERSESLEKFGQRWDRVIVGIYQLTSISLYIISGLDAGRFGWTGGVPGWVKWGAFIFVLFVYIFPTWAVVSNPYASGAVRIQEERDHQVIAKGPYKLVRHPMYLGTVVYGIAFPLFLESYWALIPGLIVIVLFIIRTALEDRYLHENLPGYAEFAQKTRTRLFPGVW